eukprot:2665047-Prymnesium_polylepis.1
MARRQRSRSVLGALATAAGGRGGWAPSQREAAAHAKGAWSPIAQGSGIVAGEDVGPRASTASPRCKRPHPLSRGETSACMGCSTHDWQTEVYACASVCMAWRATCGDIEGR